jgi:hypothetical protein
MTTRAKILGGNKSDYLAPSGALAGTEIEAGNGNDTVVGTGWDDIIRGGNGKDSLSGGGGDDRLEGGNGVDWLAGGAGNDTLVGGHGADALTGGDGEDDFVFATADSDGAGMDCVADFTAGEDQIDVSAFAGGGALAWGGTAPVANGAWHVHSGGNTLVYVDGDGDPATAELAIKLAGLHQLSPDDFIGVFNPNQAPAAADGGALGLEDGAIAITLGGADGDGAVAGVALLALPGDGTLYADATLTVPAVAGATYAGAGVTFYFLPDADFNGTVSFPFTVIDDDGASDGTPATATIIVEAVNDAPGFTVAGDVAVAEDAGPQLIAGFAADISAGPADEAGQLLTASVSTDNDGLFLVAPAIDPATGNLTFTPAPGMNGTATVTVLLSDDGGTANGGQDSHGETFVITVAAANDGPTNNLPEPVSGDEDTVIPITGLSVSDADVGEAPGEMRITLSVAHGTLTLGSVAGLAFVAGDGQADGTMTFTGALADVNAALATLSYRGDADFNGTDTLTITSDDQGYTGTGGPLVDTDSVAITVNPVADAPVAGDDQWFISTNTTASWSLAALLGDDAEADGQALTVTALSLNGTTWVTDASDGAVDGVIRLTTGFGQVVVNGTAGTITYGVNGTVGSLGFYYQTSDGTTADTGQVTVQTVATGGGNNTVDLAALGAGVGSYSYIDARAGNDTLIGGAGADVLLGNGDIDLFRVGQFGEDTVRGGGNGLNNDLGGGRRLDILAFDGALDLTELDQDRITGIETLSMLDLHNSAGADSLVLGAQDVIDLGQGTFDPFGAANLETAAAIRVDGDSGDGLTLAGGDWRAVSAGDVPSGYTLYVHDSSGTGAAEDAYVLVQNAVTVTLG